MNNTFHIKETTHNYFNKILEIFTCKSNQIPVSHSSLVLDNYKIELNFYGRGLSNKFLPAFKHLLNSSPAKQTLSIYILESKTTKIALPPPPWQVNNNLQPGEMWVCDKQNIKIIHQPTENKLIMLRHDSNEAIYWIEDAKQIPYYESSAPLRHILHWWFSRNNGQLLHAASVGYKNKGVLLVGKGGSGKSNISLACLNSNLSFISDDYCLITQNSNPHANCIFSSGKLHFEDIELHTHLKNSRYYNKEDEKQNEKALFFLYPFFKDKLLKSVPLKAIFIPHVTKNKKSKIIPISKAQAYLALAPSTVFQMKGEQQKSHKNITNLIHQLPCYILELSINIELSVKEIELFLNN